MPDPHHLSTLPMLAYRQFAYLDLEKTGCTFLRNRLIMICADAPSENIKHAPLARRTGLPRIMTIRDPWSYFLSLWKYGLDGRGGFYDAFHGSHPLAYRDRSPRSFRAFLNLALNAGGLVLGGQMMRMDIYTYRIVNQLVPVEDRADFLNSLDGDVSPPSLIAALSAYVPDILIRTGHLNRDFHQLVAAGKLPFVHLKPDWQSLFPLDAAKTNTSTGDTDGAESAYYDDWHRQQLRLSCGLALWLYEKATQTIQGAARPPAADTP